MTCSWTGFRAVSGQRQRTALRIKRAVGESKNLRNFCRTSFLSGDSIGRWCSLIQAVEKKTFVVRETATTIIHSEMWRVVRFDPRIEVFPQLPPWLRTSLGQENNLGGRVWQARVVTDADSALLVN